MMLQGLASEQLCEPAAAGNTGPASVQLSCDGFKVRVVVAIVPPPGVPLMSAPVGITVMPFVLAFPGPPLIYAFMERRSYINPPPARIMVVPFPVRSHAMPARG